jgi:HPt (histidine-containing phosphotransfer) domain-containing protein
MRTPVAVLLHESNASVACIDAPTLLAMVNRDGDLIAQLFEMFLADAPTRIARMRTAIAAGDAAALEAEAHSIKGSAGNLRVIGVAHEAFNVESAAENKDLPAAAAALNQLELLLADVPAAVHQILEALQ